MCGIIGYCSNVEMPIQKGLLSLHHRGPDAQNAKNFQAGSRHTALGHTRLSILDLSEASNQPFSSKDGRYHLTFNGEIYNYKELRSELEDLGYQFETTSDTEVLLQFLINFGPSKAGRLHGMFAIAFLDSKESKLLLLRDQLGIKPIYIYQAQEDLIWSSELRGIWSLLGRKDDLDPKLYGAFLNSGFMNEPYTGYKNILKIEPGTFLEVDFSPDSELKTFSHSYWSPYTIPSRGPINSNMDDLIDQEIESHLVSDVPLGLFFSGGVDSSVLLSYLGNRISSFLVKADQKEVKLAGFTSDYEYGKKIAEVLDANLSIVSLENETGDFMDSVRRVVEINEEPMSDYTALASELLSKTVKDQGYTVMLSGMGADEIFAGYPRYQLAHYGKYLRSFFGIARPFMRYSSFLSKKTERIQGYFEGDDFLRSYQSLLTPFRQDEISGLIGVEANDDFFQSQYDRIAKLKNHSNLKKAMALDLRGFLSHNFLVADKSSMQASIELRVPLATARLFENAFQLEEKDLLSMKRAKLPLRNYLHSRLPSELFNRRKAGFHPPLDRKIRDIGKDSISRILEQAGFHDTFDARIIKDILDNHFDGKVNNTFKIYRLLFLSQWLR